MRKGIKAVFSVVRAHTALSNSAKAHIARRKVYDDVVDTAASVGKLGAYSLDMLFVARKEIKCKRLILVF